MKKKYAISFFFHNKPIFITIVSDPYGSVSFRNSESDVDPGGKKSAKVMKIFHKNYKNIINLLTYTNIYLMYKKMIFLENIFLIDPYQNATDPNHCLLRSRSARKNHRGRRRRHGSYKLVETGVTTTDSRGGVAQATVRKSG